MTREELAALVDTVVGAWQIEVTDRRSLYRTWHRYLADLPFEAALEAVDARVIAGDHWAPRVGEIRRAAIERGLPPLLWPDPDIAWQAAEDRLRAANSGVAPKARFDPLVEDALRSAMRAAGTNDGFHKQAFLAAWAQQTAAFEQSRYGLPDNAPSVLPA